MSTTIIWNTEKNCTSKKKEKMKTRSLSLPSTNKVGSLSSVSLQVQR